MTLSAGVVAKSKNLLSISLIFTSRNKSYVGTSGHKLLLASLLGFDAPAYRYELSRLETIDSLAHDIPLDAVMTVAGGTESNLWNKRKLPS